MGDTVQRLMEDMVPELEDLRDKKIFQETEIQSIVQRRRAFEYILRRRNVERDDFLRYIQYELNLSLLREKRKNKLGIVKKSLSDFASMKRVCFLYERSLRKNVNDTDLWLQYISYLYKTGSMHSLSRLFPRALALNAKCIPLWLAAASFEIDHTQNMDSGRILLQRALRFIPFSQEIWHYFFQSEIKYIVKMMERKRVLGLFSNVEDVHTEGVHTLDKADLAMQACLLPRLIYKKAMRATPTLAHSLPFRLSFLQYIPALYNPWFIPPKRADTYRKRERKSEAIILLNFLRYNGFTKDAILQSIEQRKKLIESDDKKLSRKRRQQVAQDLLSNSSVDAPHTQEEEEEEEEEVKLSRFIYCVDFPALFQEIFTSLHQDFPRHPLALRAEAEYTLALALHRQKEQTRLANEEEKSSVKKEDDVEDKQSSKKRKAPALTSQQQHDRFNAYLESFAVFERALASQNEATATHGEQDDGIKLLREQRQVTESYIVYIVELIEKTSISVHINNTAALNQYHAALAEFLLHHLLALFQTFSQITPNELYGILSLRSLLILIDMFLKLGKISTCLNLLTEILLHRTEGKKNSKQGPKVISQFTGFEEDNKVEEILQEEEKRKEEDEKEAEARALLWSKLIHIHSILLAAAPSSSSLSSSTSSASSSKKPKTDSSTSSSSSSSTSSSLSSLSSTTTTTTSVCNIISLYENAINDVSPHYTTYFQLALLQFRLTRFWLRGVSAMTTENDIHLYENYLFLHHQFLTLLAHPNFSLPPAETDPTLLSTSSSPSSSSNSSASSSTSNLHLPFSVSSYRLKALYLTFISTITQRPTLWTRIQEGKKAFQKYQKQQEESKTPSSAIDTKKKEENQKQVTVRNVANLLFAPSTTLKQSNKSSSSFSVSSSSSTTDDLIQLDYASDEIEWTALEVDIHQIIDHASQLFSSLSLTLTNKLKSIFTFADVKTVFYNTIDILLALPPQSSDFVFEILRIEEALRPVTSSSTPTLVTNNNNSEYQQWRTRMRNHYETLFKLIGANNVSIWISSINFFRSIKDFKEANSIIYRAQKTLQPYLLPEWNQAQTSLLQ